MSTVNLAQDRLKKAVSRIDAAIERIAKERSTETEQMGKELASAQKRTEELEALTQAASKRLESIIGRLEGLRET